MALQEMRRVLVVSGTDREPTDLAASFESLPYVVAYSNDVHTVVPTADDDCQIVLLSHTLPDEQCRTLLEKRGHADSKLKVPIIIIAPSSEPHTVEKYLSLGANDFLFTPTTPALLQARIESTLTTYNLQNRTQTRLKDEATLKLEHDLQVARRIQAGFLPRSLPQPSGWEISARFQPAREVAGDFYDAFMLSQNRRIAFVIADVVDKGVPAALFMALVRSLTRAFAQQNYSINWSDLLGSGSESRTAKRKPQKRVIPTTGTVSLYNAVLLTNNYIIDNHLDDNMFATLFFGLLDPSNGQVAYINAGHNPPFVFDANGKLKAALKNTGTAVGMFPDVDYTIEFTQMEPGDILYTYTDGVTEARNAAGEFLTEKGLLSLLAEPTTSATALLDRVDNYLREFMVHAVQFDDITMMALRYAKD
jgi:sigma-B regulation protein RsbU (phosphoserine phosphatase)